LALGLAPIADGDDEWRGMRDTNVLGLLQPRPDRCTAACSRSPPTTSPTASPGRSRPAHVDVDLIVVRPVAQATATVVARQEHP
jgi:hypothetical protein